ncbi:MAG: phosphatase PAP2 family protein [Erysipelothrix sp.]|nr:phosphatase PAP2 family protein [Erysipelothrix sp.]
MDVKVLFWIQSLRIPFLDYFFKYFTVLGNHGEIWFAMIFIFACFKKTRRAAYLAFIALAIELLIVSVIMKPMIMRPRPFITYDTVELLIKAPGGSSFPSGHAASSIAVAFVFYFNKVKFRKVIMVLALLMAFSRVYLFVHYPSDVLFGFFTGVAIAMLLKLYQDQIIEKTKVIYRKVIRQ